MNGREPVPMWRKQVVVSLHLVSRRSLFDTWEAESNHIDKSFEREMCTIIDYLQSKKYDQVPELDFPNWYS